MKEEGRLAPATYFPCKEPLLLGALGILEGGLSVLYWRDPSVPSASIRAKKRGREGGRARLFRGPFKEKEFLKNSTMPGGSVYLC